MPLTSLSAPEPGPEVPTAFAELKIEVGPAQPRGSATGKVLPDQAHDLITTFGVLGSVVAGIAGAVLTLRRSSGLTTPAFAELALAGTSAVLIATRRGADRRAAGTRRSLERQTPSRRTETSLASGNPTPAQPGAKQMLRIGRGHRGARGGKQVPHPGVPAASSRWAITAFGMHPPDAKIVLHAAPATADSPSAGNLQQKPVARLL